MSLDKNILKNLLNKLLESKLQRLEKRNTEQIKDLKTIKEEYKKQGQLLNKLTIKKKPALRLKTFDNKNINYKSPMRKKGEQDISKLKLASSNSRNIYSRNARTPERNQNLPPMYSTRTDNRNLISGYFNNKKYDYVKSRYRDEPKNRNNENINTNKKICLTPEPKIKRKRRLSKKNNNKKIVNIKPQKLNLNPDFYKKNSNINIYSSNNNIYSYNNKNNNNNISNSNNNINQYKKNIESNINNNKNRKRNINTIKREENNKKRTIVSNIELEADEINFVLEELRKPVKREDINNEENDNNDKNENNSSSHNSNDSNSSSKSSNSNSSNSSNNSNNSNSSNSSTTKNSSHKKKIVIINKEIANKFTKFLFSSDGGDILSLISTFLDKKTKICFLSISKKLLRHLTFYIDDLYHDLLKINNINISNSIEDKIKAIKKKYGEEDLDSPKYAFSLSNNSVKALDFLDSDSYNDIFRKSKLDPPLDKIILIYRIFFQLINKEELVKIENDKKFWKKARKFILENNEGKTGTFIREYISEFDFTSENIYQLKKVINGNEDKLKPLYYENICKTTVFFLFIIKDSLEYCGIIQNDKKTMPSVVINYLEDLQKNINRAKDYIDSLKEMSN